MAETAGWSESQACVFTAGHELATLGLGSALKGSESSEPAKPTGAQLQTLWCLRKHGLPEVEACVFSGQVGVQGRYSR